MKCVVQRLPADITVLIKTMKFWWDLGSIILFFGQWVKSSLEIAFPLMHGVAKKGSFVKYAFPTPKGLSKSKTVCFQWNYFRRVHLAAGELSKIFFNFFTFLFFCFHFHEQVILWNMFPMVGGLTRVFHCRNCISKGKWTLQERDSPFPMELHRASHFLLFLKKNWVPF